jgi:trypsin-like peptidase
MKSSRITALVLCFHLALLTSLAQQSTSGQAPIATATSAPQTVIEQIRNVVAFLSVAYQDGPSTKGVIGTCFFISVLDKRLGENQSFIYLVTNRHVAQPGIEHGAAYPPLGAFLRLNLIASQGEIQSFQGQIPLGNQRHWYFPQDDAVDLAILPLAPDQSIYSYQMIPSSLIATSDQVKAGDVVVGDRVVFAGYFSNFPGQKRIEPIIRQGIIAMLPDENLDTTLHKPGRLYLADLHAFHGNSGSPVLVNVGGTPHHGETILSDNYRLLGLISGYYPESVGFSVPAATVLTGEVRDNSGIATIVPADELNKLLNSAELRADQDTYVANLTKKP